MTAPSSPEAPWPVRTVARKIADWIGRLGEVWVEGQVAQLSRLVDDLLDIARAGNAVAVNGRTVLVMNDMGSRMSPIKPLGSYEMAMDWRGQEADLTLRTVRGALLLSGSGALQNGRLRFSGQAAAAEGYEDTLGNLLGLLGQRRMVNGKNIIALEFR